MARNFLDGCEAVGSLCDDVEGLKPERIDEVVTQAGITMDSDPDELKYLREGTGIDSIGAITAADAAESCNVCENLGQCMLGNFLSSKL